MNTERRSTRKSRKARPSPAGASAPKQVGLRPAESDRGVGAYVRVSSASQTSKSQREAIARAAAARGEPITWWYEDTRTGSTLTRAALTRLRNDVRAGKLRSVYVYRLDRLTRTGVADTLRLLNELRGGGCRVRSVADGLDVDDEGPMGELWTLLLAWFARLERQVILDRQATARERIEAAGGSWGRPRRLTPEREAWVLRQVKSRTIEDVAASSGVSESTIRRLVRRRKRAA